MQDNLKFIVDSIQSILDENNGFIAVSKLSPLMSAELRDKLGVKPNATVKVLMKKLEPVLDENFAIHKKGNSRYIIIPREPEDFMLDVLSEDKQLTVKEIAKVLQLFTNDDVAKTLTELENSGRVKVAVDEKLTVRFLTAGEAEMEHKETVNSEEYTREAFRKAFDKINRRRDFVPIHELRKALGWPRETFDNMLRTLRNDETIQMHIGDAHLMTPDEVKDSYIDELNYLMGTVTWNV